MGCGVGGGVVQGAPYLCSLLLSLQRKDKKEFSPSRLCLFETWNNCLSPLAGLPLKEKSQELKGAGVGTTEGPGLFWLLELSWWLS